MITTEMFTTFYANHTELIHGIRLAIMVTPFIAIPTFIAYVKYTEKKD